MINAFHCKLYPNLVTQENLGLLILYEMLSKRKISYTTLENKIITNWNELQKIPEQTKTVMKEDEEKHYCDIVIQNKTNSKKMWNIIKDVINRNKRKNFSLNLN